MVFGAALAAQSAELRVTPAVRVNERIDFLLTGDAGDAFATLLDSHGGPVALSDGVLHLGGRTLVLFDSGVLGATGFRLASLSVPFGAAIGVPLYAQSVTLGRTARVQLTDGESSAVYATRFAIVQDFRDPAAEGISGSYDTTVRGRLQGLRARVRTHDLLPAEGIEFGQPLRGALNVDGVRLQSVYRAIDLGADGTQEEITAIRWLPFRSRQVLYDSGYAIDLRVAHSAVVPDYAVDPVTALPRAPLSGLDLNMAANVKAGEQLVELYRGPYTIDPLDRRADGFMPYPTLSGRFTYNGVDSLVIDYRTTAPTANGVNGHQVFLMVQSSPQPNARVFAIDADPYSVTVADEGDCTWIGLQIEFVRRESMATSRWLAAPTLSPDYQAPVVSQSVPAGSSIALEYRGARTAIGGSSTVWSSSIDVADGYAYLQYRARFSTALGSALAPSIDQIVIPVQ